MLMQRLRDAEGRKVLDRINDSTHVAEQEKLEIANLPEMSGNNSADDSSSVEDTDQMLEVYEEF
jgi:hypothetical protein